MKKRKKFIMTFIKDKGNVIRTLSNLTVIFYKYGFIHFYMISTNFESVYKLSKIYCLTVVLKKDMKGIA